MSGLIQYRIADHYIGIKVRDIDMARKLLPSHEPFLSSIRPDNEEPGRDLLYTINTGVHIDIPGREFMLEEEELEDGRRSWVYSKDSKLYIVVEQAGCTNALMWDEARETFHTDATFMSLSEHPNIRVMSITAFSIATAPHRTIKVHASVIEYEGRALLFLGKSGTGKSTHSRLWLDNVEGCTLLNDDAPIMRVHEDGSVRVYGAPWSGSTPCYRDVDAEVVALIHLYQSPDNVLTPVDGITAISSMIEATGMLRNDKKNKNQIFSTITDILSSIPLYRLDCRPDIEALALTRGLMGV